MSPSDRPLSVGFTVVYRWRLHDGAEERFRSAWARMTDAIRGQRGGLGSRLHRAADGTYVAYAQWPSRVRWEAARAEPSSDPEASRIMEACIAETHDPLLLDVLEDMLGGPRQ